MQIQRLRWLLLVLLDALAMYESKGRHEGLRKVSSA